MMMTPTRPTPVAIQRRRPTFSPRKTIDSAVTNSGATKPVAEASAIGRKLSPEMKNSDEASTVRPRSNCKPSRPVGSANSGEPGIIAGVMISANTRNRIQAISIEGSVADRYFAVTSEAPRNTVDARINASPVKGRSARAGALGAADFFSGNGSGALSSLAAAAGGGVTAISNVVNIGSGEAPQNANWLKTTRSENRMRICTDAHGRPAAAVAAPCATRVRNRLQRLAGVTVRRRKIIVAERRIGDDGNAVALAPRDHPVFDRALLQMIEHLVAGDLALARDRQQFAEIVGVEIADAPGGDFS